MRRREVIVSGALGAGSSLLPGKRLGAQLVFPDNMVPSIVAEPSPPATPWVAPFNRMPWMRPVSPRKLRPPPDPARHQRYEEFKPRRFYIERIQEFLWQYHPEPPYDRGSWSWGFNGITPGPTYRARYGEPILVRRFNDLPHFGTGNVRFALPSVTIHLHNAHTASESDGIPSDFFEVGEFYDYHYANFPAGFDDREKLTTLWYHDHRVDYTAPNVYAGLSGIYLFFDKQDSGNERDPRPGAFRLPSGRYDVPMILHDVQFDQNGQAVWDFLDPVPSEEGLGVSGGTFTVNGMIGDRVTVNRIIKPFLEVEPRKYRLRIINGGPSRFYELHLRVDSAKKTRVPRFVVLSTDGNLLPEPIEADKLRLAVAQRHDVVVDFSRFAPGDHVYLVNRLEMRVDGAGPTGRLLDEGDPILRFEVVRGRGDDPSRIPDRLRDLPSIDLDEVQRERIWNFDYTNGLWTINGQLFDENRTDARVEQGSAEIWTFRSSGNAWSHPTHIHFEEFQILERNHQPLEVGDVERSRRDDMWIGPNDEFKIFMRFRDFFGSYVMHCHNVVHEDNAMMIRFDVVPPGQGD